MPLCLRHQQLSFSKIILRKGSSISEQHNSSISEDVDELVAELPASRPGREWYRHSGRKAISSDQISDNYATIVVAVGVSLITNIEAKDNSITILPIMLPRRTSKDINHLILGAPKLSILLRRL